MKLMTGVRFLVASLLVFAAGTVQPKTIKLREVTEGKWAGILKKLSAVPSTTLFLLDSWAQNSPQTSDVQDYTAQVIQDTFTNFNTYNPSSQRKLVRIYNKLLTSPLLRDEQKDFLKNTVLAQVEPQLQALPPQSEAVAVASDLVQVRSDLIQSGASEADLAQLNKVEVAAPVQVAAPIQAVAPVQAAAPVQVAAPTQAVAPVQVAAPVQLAAPVQVAAPVQQTVTLPAATAVTVQPAVVPVTQTIVTPVTEQSVAASVVQQVMPVANPTVQAVGLQGGVMPTSTSGMMEQNVFNVMPAASVGVAIPAQQVGGVPTATQDLEETIKNLYRQIQAAQGQRFDSATQGAFGAALVEAFNGVVELQSYMSQLLTAAQETSLLNDAQHAYVRDTMIPNLDQVSGSTPTKSLDHAAKKDGSKKTLKKGKNKNKKVVKKGNVKRKKNAESVAVAGGTKKKRKKASKNKTTTTAGSVAPDANTTTPSE